MKGSSRRLLAFAWILPILSGGNLVHAFGLPLTMEFSEMKPLSKTTTLSSLSTAPSTATTTPSRRSLLQTTMIAITAAQLWPSQPAHAAYGASSNMELPNYIEFLLEKNAVPDEGAFLYQGPDPKVQLQRLLDATKRLDSIPPLAEDKKWSQIQGILTGPLGTLAQTLTAIAGNASSKSSAAELATKSKKVKEDIFNINLAASKKNPDAVVANARAAQASLEAFVRAAF